MGLLHKIWDETLAGPAPESGLGKLRKYDSFNSMSSVASPSGVEAPADDLHQPVQISRSITVLRSNAHRDLTVSVDSQSTPSSPSGSTAPNSPFSPSSPGGNFKKLWRRKSAATHNSEPKSPTGYDWIVLSSLER